MQKKKIFVQKNLRSRSRPHMKVLLWAAAAVIILVIATPLILHQKNVKESKKPASEKGLVVKGIPKASGPPSDNAAQPEGMNDEYPKGPGSAPGAVVDSTGPNRPGMDELSKALTQTPPPVSDLKPKDQPAASSSDEPLQTEHPVAKKPEPAAPSIADLGQKTASAGPAPKAQMKAPAGAGRSDAVGGNKKVIPAGGKVMYSVQVGSFKDKKTADEMQKNLRKKGYECEVTASADPKSGQPYVVRLQPVGELRKASTLLEQVKQEQRVQKPVIVQLPQ